MKKPISYVVFAIHIFVLLILSLTLGYAIKTNIDENIRTIDYLTTQTEMLSVKVKTLETENEEHKRKFEHNKNNFEQLKTQIEELQTQVLYCTEMNNIIHLEETERIYLAKLLQRECGGEPFECKMAVAFVVLNRTLSELYPDTITEVINQTGQFEPVSSGSINSAVPNEDCYFAIEMVLNMNYSDLLQYFDDIYFFRAATTEKVFGSNTKYAYTLGKTDFYTYK